MNIRTDTGKEANMSSTFNRGTGLLIVNVVNSNPNGDPDGESEPRTFEGDGRGLISAVSFKRKLRDLMENEVGEVRNAALAAAGGARSGWQYGVLESRDRDRRRNVPRRVSRRVLGWPGFREHLS
jgi:CRISPR-associated protein Csd2